MISQNITKMIGEAMKAHDTIRVSTLRMLSSEFNYEKIKLQHDLSDQEELSVVRKEAKKRKEAIELYQNQNIKDKLEQEKAELIILQDFLPAELTDEELNQLISDSINELGAKSIQDLGRVIGFVKSKAPGADGGTVAQLVRQKLGVDN